MHLATSPTNAPSLGYNPLIHDEDEAEEEEESAEPPPLKIVPETHAVARWAHDTCVRLTLGWCVLPRRRGR
jgi:hypothetical protein